MELNDIDRKVIQECLEKLKATSAYQRYYDDMDVTLTRGVYELDCFVTGQWWTG